ncbi:hypothetical protein C8Q76DRAFT_461788 [Earliella scabrosa]|nr:hypothetical protein C8Q76DRAFT_461788 [Earliella scabrosa]
MLAASREPDRIKAYLAPFVTGDTPDYVRWKEDIGSELTDSSEPPSDCESTGSVSTMHDSGSEDEIRYDSEIGDEDTVDDSESGDESAYDSDSEPEDGCGARSTGRRRR